MHYNIGPMGGRSALISFLRHVDGEPMKLNITDDELAEIRRAVERLNSSGSGGTDGPFVTINSSADALAIARAANGHLDAKEKFFEASRARRITESLAASTPADIDAAKGVESSAEDAVRRAANALGDFVHRKSRQLFERTMSR